MATKKLFVTDRKAVRESFGKTDKEILEDIGIVRGWVKTQPHLPEVPSDNMIEIFLMNNKFSIEKTKQKLDMYYTIRSHLPQFYVDSNPQLPQMQEVLDKMGIFISFPKQTEEHHKVYLMKFSKNPEVFDVNKFIAHLLNVLEVKTQCDVAAGDIYIVDHEHLQMGHVVKMTPMHIKNGATVLEKVFSNRIKGIHIINAPPFFDIIISICKAVLKPKLFERLQVHQNIESLYEHVPREILPKDYGGEEASIVELISMCTPILNLYSPPNIFLLVDLWKDCLKEHSARFDKLDQMKVNEDLRPTPLENDEVLGYHGNFKKLDVF